MRFKSCFALAAPIAAQMMGFKVDPNSFSSYDGTVASDNGVIVITTPTFGFV